MIRGVHAMFYSSQASELRDFIRDKLRLPYTDVGHGWLIFDLKEGDAGATRPRAAPPRGRTTSRSTATIWRRRSPSCARAASRSTTRSPTTATAS